LTTLGLAICLAAAAHAASILDFSPTDLGGSAITMPDVYGESSPKPTPMVGESGTVAAVEPNPPTIARLERNIQLNHAANIVVRKVACAKT
jgi:hypothetical protein